MTEPDRTEQDRTAAAAFTTKNHAASLFISAWPCPALPPSFFFSHSLAPLLRSLPRLFCPGHPSQCACDRGHCSVLPPRPESIFRFPCPLSHSLLGKLPLSLSPLPSLPSSPFPLPLTLSINAQTLASLSLPQSLPFARPGYLCSLNSWLEHSFHLQPPRHGGTNWLWSSWGL